MDGLELIKKYNIPIVEIDLNRAYWLVRTNSGEYFNEFDLGNFIGINWNQFNDPNDFTEAQKEATTIRIAETYKDNKQPGHTFSQIKRFFHDIKIGDIVMIPSKDSKYIGFGEVASNVGIIKKSQTEIDEGECPYEKRRSVKWIKIVERKKLDPYLYRMMSTHLTISNANDYADAIDRTLHSYYYKGDKAHLILNVEQENDIPLVDLLEALQAPLELVDVINELDDSFGNHNKRDLDAKLRVQSPGVIELASVGPAFALVAILGMVIVAVVGGSFTFKKTTKDGDETEGTLKSDGVFEKLLKWRQQTHTQEMEKEVLEVDEVTFDRMMAIQEQLNRATKTLKIELPEELTVPEQEKEIPAVEIVETKVVEKSEE